MSQDLDAITDRAIAGDRLSREDLQTLFEKADLIELGQAAHLVRERLVDAGTATFIVDRNINYTNVCVYRCRFCAFHRCSGDPDAYLLPFEQIADKVAETVAAGGTGILLQGGVHPDLRLDYYEQLLHQLKTTFQDQSTDLEGEVEPSGGYDYLRTLAISRLALDNITHVQGSWVTQGMKIGQLSLAFGADDLGSIMLEENVVAAAGTSHRMALDDMERIIRGAGYEPRQRRTLYEPL